MASRLAEGSICAFPGVAVTHPISLSRMVLEKTEHVLLAGAGASLGCGEDIHG